jgi:hypothetical protein
MKLPTRLAGIPIAQAQKFWEDNCDDTNSVFFDLRSMPFKTFQLVMAFAQFFADDQKRKRTDDEIARTEKL